MSVWWAEIQSVKAVSSVSWWGQKFYWLHTQTARVQILALKWPRNPPQTTLAGGMGKGPVMNRATPGISADIVQGVSKKSEHSHFVKELHQIDWDIHLISPPRNFNDASNLIFNVTAIVGHDPWSWCRSSGWSQQTSCCTPSRLKPSAQGHSYEVLRMPHPLQDAPDLMVKGVQVMGQTVIDQKW